jgi:general secretion pathway protein C
MGAATPATAPKAPTASARLRLLGVVAGGPGKGAALIAVDGQPPKSFRVGSSVVDSLWLVSVSRRQVVLGQEARSTNGTTLEMPSQSYEPNTPVVAKP